MGLGGPVWHTSVRPQSRVTEKQLRRMADKVLDGVGDPRLGEWVEHHESIHLRRRLSEREQLLVGPVLDVRRTEEARQRAKTLPSYIHQYLPAEILADELGSTL